MLSKWQILGYMSEVCTPYISNTTLQVSFLDLHFISAGFSCTKQSYLHLSETDMKQFGN